MHIHKKVKINKVNTNKELQMKSNYGCLYTRGTALNFIAKHYFSLLKCDINEQKLTSVHFIGNNIMLNCIVYYFPALEINLRYNFTI